MARKIDRLQSANTQSPQQLHRRVNVAIDQVETALNDIDGNVAAIAALQADMLDRITEIAAAQAAADAVTLANSISSSFTSPGTILSATDAGSNASVIVAAHTRKYDDGTNLSVNSHTFTGKAYTTTYYVYYDDATRADTTPSYQITTNPNTALSNTVAGRHFCGSVTTPAAAAPDTSGGVDPPSGGGGIFHGEVP